LSKIKRLAGETVLYGLGSILPRFLNFLLVPLHTAVFDEAAYGIFSQIFAYVAVINILFTFGMETAYFRFASSADHNEKKIFDLTQSVVVIISAALTAIFLINFSPIADHLDIPGKENLVLYLIVIMFIDAIVAIPFARLRLMKQPLRFAAGRLINIALLVGLNLYFFVWSDLQPDITYIVLANLIANGFYLLFLGRDLLTWRPQFDRTLTPRIFTYAYPVMITGLAGMLNENLSRITLDKWLPSDFYKDPKAAVGVFSANYKYAVLMNLAIQAFRFAAEPFFFAQSSEKNSPQLFARVNHYFVIVCCLLLLGVSTNLDILKYFLRREGYWEGIHIVPILLLAYLFLGVYYNFSVWFKITDKTKYGTLITFIGVIVTVMANYLLIPVLGYLGSSIAALLCYFIMTVVCYGLGQRYFPVPYTVGRDLAYIIGTTILVYVVYAIDPFIEAQAFRTTFHLGIFAVFTSCVLLFERKGLRPTPA
jgi:O-antigen/teichoic acid export membrane protein